MSPHSVELRIPESEIQVRVRELASELEREYAGRVPLLIAILKGSHIFLADISRQIQIPHRVEFMRASSYRGETTQAGELALELSSIPEVAGEHVVILDDILDTGRTLQEAKAIIQSQSPASVKTMVLLWKKGVSAEVRADFVGFEIAPTEFVVGYGLDYDDQFRHLPYIGILKKSLIQGNEAPLGSN